MCGISGELRFDNQPASATAVEKMLAKLQKRGPDGQGLFTFGPVALGHRRLKIIDLSNQSHQPMYDPYLGKALVFNGCLYNYKELKKELQELSYRFFTKGDTEVVLKSFDAWGPEAVKRFKGMFAFCLWDQKTGTSYLGRDHSGIKPLYYSLQQKRLRFASTLPAILAAGETDTRIDPIALNYYMSFHGIVPAPHTILQGVRKVPPATLVEVSAEGQIKSWQYWQLDFASLQNQKKQEKLTQNEWQEKLYVSLQTAVKRRMTADVPVGVLLSGGLDSSLLVGLLAQMGQDLNTFSIGFESTPEEQGDEFFYSDLVAQHFKSRHNKIFVSSQQALAALPACIAAMSEPMVSHDVIGFYLLSQQVSQQVKVVQCGQGADEVFAGYHWYQALQHSQNPAGDYKKLFCDRSFQAYQEQLEPEWVQEDYSGQFVDMYFAERQLSSAVDYALDLDSRIMLVDDPVKRVDNMTMAWGLEARVPFLDHELLELAASMPRELKVKDGGKYLLKEVARSIIPHGVIDRPKGYFPVPALKYLDGAYLSFIKEIFSQIAFQKRGIFKGAYIDQLLASPKDHITPLRGSELWQIASLEYWLQLNHIA